MFLARADGSLTGNIEEMLQHVHAAWMPVFRKYSGSPEPSASDFLEKYRRVLDPVVARFRVGPLTVEEVRVTLSRMSGDSASGVDGLTVKEMKELKTLKAMRKQSRVQAFGI